MTFPIVPVNTTAAATLGAIVVLLVALAVYLVRYSAPTLETTTVVGCVVVLVVAAGLGYILYGSFHSTVTVDERSLDFDVPLYGRSIPRDSIDLTRARVFNMHESDELRFRVRTNGLAIPGYWIGWFKLTDKTRALVLLTDRSRVVHVPLKDGSALIFSIEAAQEFLQALSAAPASQTLDSLNE